MTGRSPRRRCTGAGGPAVAAAVLTAVLALYVALVALGNVTDFDTNREYVRHVLSMDTTFRDPDLMWRAVTSPALQDIVYLTIIAWQVLSTAVLVWALVRWGAALRGRADARARALTSTGCLMMVALWTGGFIAVGGEWFAMWQSSDWNGLQPALQVTIMALFTLVITWLPAPGEERAGPAR